MHRLVSTFQGLVPSNPRPCRHPQSELFRLFNCARSAALLLATATPVSPKYVCCDKVIFGLLKLIDLRIEDRTPYRRVVDW